MVKVAGGMGFPRSRVDAAGFQSIIANNLGADVPSG